MLPAIAVLLGVALVPVLAGLAGLAGVSAGAMQAVLAAPGARPALQASLLTGILATLLAFVLAHAIVMRAGTTARPGRLGAVLLPLLAVPHLALGIGLALLLAPSGLLLRLLSPWLTGYTEPPDWATVNDPAGLALVLGLVIKETAFLGFALLAALPQVDSAAVLRAGASLGYPPWRAWLLGVAPRLAAQTRLALAAVLVYGLTNVELALPLGPRTPPTFAILVWQWFGSGDPADRERALAGAVLLLIATLLALLLLAAAGRLATALLTGCARRGQRAGWSPSALVHGVALLGAALGGAAVLALALRAVSAPLPFPDLLAADGLHPVSIPGLGAALRASLVLALAVAAATVLLLLPVAEALATRPRPRQRVGALLFVPLLLPQLAFLFGLQVLLVRLGVDGRLATVVWAQLLFALPYAWGVLAPARAALDPRLLWVARSLGASPARAWWRVTLPLLRPALSFTAALAAAVSAAVYLPTLFAGAGRVATLATEAAAAMASGNLREAASWGALQAALPLMAFALAFAASRWRRGYRPDGRRTAAVGGGPP